MAEHKIRKNKAEEKTHWLNKEPEPAFEREKAQDEAAEMDTMDLTSQEHAALLNDVHFAHSTNAEQKAHVVTGLQRSYGNAYVQRLLSPKTIQAKLTVNPPDNQYEREADRMADAVTQSTQAQIQRQPLEEEEEMLQPKPVGNHSSLEIQRQEEQEEEELQAKPVGNQSSLEIQRQEEEEEELLQPKIANNKTPEVPNNMETRINAARENGQPLPHSIRTSFEPHFKHDFNEVRIHTDAEANRLSQQLGAMAFTTGRDVFFQENAYDPNSSEGKRLLGHELTHVVQQSAVLPKADAKIPESTETASTELTETIARVTSAKEEEEIKTKETEAKEKAEAKKEEAKEKAKAKKEEAKEKAKAKKDEIKQEAKGKGKDKGKEESKKKTEAKAEETKEKETAKKEETKAKAKAKEEEEAKKEAAKEKIEAKKEEEEKSKS